jgi:putative nucleotidyltransferase with HDIG domain
MELGRVAREQAQSIVESTDLPVLFADLPGQARDAVEAGDEEAEDLNDILEQESHLLLSVLGMANRSQQTGTRALDVDTAARWIGRAGLEEILADDGGDRQIAEEARPWLHRWWVHSMAVGHIAATLARPLGIQVAQARTAGLIHDVGRALLLKSSLSDKAQRCYDLGRNMAIATTFAEQSLLGLNHKQIGAEVCRRYGVPALLGGVVETHDQDETQIQRLDSASAQMARLISAADALAKSDGYASLPNDELRPIPAALAWHIQQINAQLNATLAELQTLLSWRLGEQMPQRMTQVVPMRGFTVAMLTETPLEANPYLRFLAQAGAAVQAVADPRELTSQQIICDVLVIDQTDQSLVGCLQTLRRLTQSDYLQAIPMLVLARRSDDPETTLKQAGLDLPIYATPIRMHTLCQSIRRLIEQG